MRSIGFPLEANLNAVALGLVGENQKLRRAVADLAFLWLFIFHGLSSLDLAWCRRAGRFAVARGEWGMRRNEQRRETNGGLGRMLAQDFHRAAAGDRQTLKNRSQPERFTNGSGRAFLSTKP